MLPGFPTKYPKVDFVRYPTHTINYENKLLQIDYYCVYISDHFYHNTLRTCEALMVDCGVFCFRQAIMSCVPPTP